jgi:hypothetical protein
VVCDYIQVTWEAWVGGLQSKNSPEQKYESM